MAHALDLIGERWALLVVRELLLGPKRFTDLRRGLPGASPNALTDRLRDLTEIGVVRRRRLQPPAASWVYELTDWGHELEPILISLGTWAIRSSRHDGTGHLSVDSVMLTIRTYYSADAARTGTIEVRLGEDRFGVWLDGRGVDVRHEVPLRPDVVLTSDAATLSGVFGDRAATRAALDEGTRDGIGDGDRAATRAALDEGTRDGIGVAGDRRLAVHLLEHVTVPDPAPAAARH
jgi:DNA-binding HxlR family transcriptional regulator